MRQTCESCGTERGTTSGPCSVCGAASVAVKAQAWRTVHVARTTFEANLVSGFLQANDVPARVRDSNAGSRSLGLTFCIAGIEVLTPSHEFARARAMLATTPCGKSFTRQDTEFLELQDVLSGRTPAHDSSRLTWLLVALFASAATAIAVAVGMSSKREAVVIPHDPARVTAPEFSR